MKCVGKILLLGILSSFVLLSQGITQTNSSLQKIDTGKNEQINGIYANSAGLITIVTQSGIAMHSTDGGTTWYYNQLMPDESFNGVTGWTDMSTGQTNMVAVGDNGSKWVSRDGGTTWEQSNFTTSSNLNAVCNAPDPNQFGNQYVWSVGDKSNVFFSNDNGNNWTQQSTPYQYDDLKSVWFTDSQTGSTVGTTGIIYGTTNSGNTWKYQEGDHSNPTYKAVYFINENVGWIVGKDGVILYTADGGKTWVKKISGTKETLNAVGFRDNQNGYAAGDNGTMLQTNDGGSSWSTVTTETTSDFKCLWQDKDGNFYFGGSDGFVYVAKYGSTKQSDVAVQPEKANFSAVGNGVKSTPQLWYINTVGNQQVFWALNSNQDWLNITPTSGTGPGYASVNVDPAQLPEGHYDAQVTLTSNDNQPQIINVGLDVLNPQNTEPPFGAFESPANGTTVSGSVPVTGWVLDDVGVDNVRVYSEGSNGNLNYLGDATLTEGVRPDIQSLYSEYPNNQKAGWGYMLLTNFLPNGGNGSYNLQVKATDVEGNTKTLGSQTIICDNANAVKPFGNIDAPALGGTASGSSYINSGWALTPCPNQIPTDGSTIHVVLDGSFSGHPVYNVNRSDIASLFPDYANSQGAVGYFEIDTRSYENGVHTIQWTVIDDAGNNNGIGSRYFTISNSEAGAPGSNTSQVSAATSNGSLRKSKREAYDFHADLTAPNPLIKSFYLINRGQQPLDWTASTDQSWVTVEPTSGSGEGWIFVTFDPTGLSSGEYRASVTIEEINNASAPYNVKVNFNVLDETDAPFGEFTYPNEGATTMGSIRLSGWALDDIGVESVTIYQVKNDDQVLLGNAQFVRGSRPDVAMAYAYLPDADRACWNYTLQTNALEDGEYQFRAVVSDFEGNETVLEGAPFTIDNSILTIPFGDIETPEEGKAISGDSYAISGWILAAGDNVIPEDGSTIHMMVDGVSIGSVEYNLPRNDIAAIYQAYQNSAGPGGLYFLNTTDYSDGNHTIGWSVSDEQGNQNQQLGSKQVLIQNMSITSDTEQEVLLPVITDLMPIYPNPFNPSTTIQYTIANQTHVSISVYNLLGEQVVMLVDNHFQSAGAYQVQWDGRNGNGQYVSSGIYFLTIKTDDFVKTRKMMMLR